jgi:DHA2 family multidrug resistance protein
LWHWCFLINLPVGVLSLVLVFFLIRESEAGREERRRV